MLPNLTDLSRWIEKITKQQNKITILSKLLNFQTF